MSVFRKLSKAKGADDANISSPARNANLARLLSPSTIEKYETIVRYLKKETERRRGTGSGAHLEFGPGALVQTWYDGLENVMWSTSVKRKAALAWWFARPGASQEDQNALILLRSYEIPLSIKSNKFKDNKCLKQNNIRHGPRPITFDEFNILIKFLNKRSTRNNIGLGRKAAVYMHAIVSCGARPNEWAGAMWKDEEQKILQIPNSKIKNIPPGWSHVPASLFDGLVELPEDSKIPIVLKTINEVESKYQNIKNRKFLNNRTWLEEELYHPDGTLNQTLADSEYEEKLRKVENLSSKEIAILRIWHRHSIKHLSRDVPIKEEFRSFVSEHMENIKKFSSNKIHLERYQTLSKSPSFDYCEKLRKVINAECKKAFTDGKLFSPYDMRSQFSSNSKSEFGVQVAAVLMGHTGTRTIGQNYGGSIDAWPKNRLAGQVRRQNEKLERGENDGQGQDGDSPDSMAPTG